MESDYLKDELIKALDMLIRDSDGLQELVVPVRSGDSNVGGSKPHTAGPRVPVSLTMLDLKMQTEELLLWWHAQLASDSQRRVMCWPSLPLAQRADQLKQHIDELCSMPWAKRCAEQIIAQAMTVADVVSPAPSLDDPTPIEIGTAREIARWAQWLGREVSRSSIQRWVKRGLIPSELALDGRQLVRLADVLELAPRKKF